MLFSTGNRIQASHNLCFQVQHSHLWVSEACATEEIFKLLFMHHLTFGLGGTDDLAIINRVWLYKEPQISVLQANAKLVQKGLDLESEVWVQYSLGNIFNLLLDFFGGFSCSKYFDGNIGIITIFCVFLKNPNQFKG